MAVQGGRNLPAGESANLDSLFSELERVSDLLSPENVWVVGVLEGFLQTLQLSCGESYPVPTLQLRLGLH